VSKSKVKLLPIARCSLGSVELVRDGSAGVFRPSVAGEALEGFGRTMAPEGPVGADPDVVAGSIAVGSETRAKASKDRTRPVLSQLAEVVLRDSLFMAHSFSIVLCNGKTALDWQGSVVVVPVDS
jgi:hypothetical protein